MRSIPRQEIFKILGDLEGNVGLFVGDLETGDTMTINADEIFVACSLIKVPIQAFLLKRAEEGLVNLDELVEIPPSKIVGGTGLLCCLNSVPRYTWRDLMTLMIAVSDNSATNVIIDLLGVENLNSFFVSMGLSKTVLQRKMLDMQSIEEGRNNYTTAADMGNLLRATAQGEFISPSVSEVLVKTMRKQIHTNKLPALVPAIPSYATTEEKETPPSGKVTVANKTGELAMTQHDMGIFLLPGGKKYVIVMLTSELKSDRSGIDAIAAVSKIIYDAFVCQGAGNKA